MVTAIGPAGIDVASRRGAWVAPTVRACRSALLAVAGVAAVFVFAAVTAGAHGVALPIVQLWIALGALATAAAAPHDPAASLLAALPTGRGRRLVHRATIGTFAAVAAWVLGGWGVDALVTVAPGATIGDSVPALLALVAIAVAACTRCGAWGALTPLALVAAGHLVGDTSALSDALRLWWTDPGPVVAAAVGATVLHHRSHW